MSLILINPSAKADALTLLKTILSMLLFPGRVPPSAKTEVISHIDWMERQTEPMDVSCVIETFPSTRTTRIVIEYKFQPTPEAPRQ